MAAEQQRDGAYLVPGRVLSSLRGVAIAFLAGAAVVALLYQVPARHVVDIGGYDAAYVQGFHDAERITDTAPAPYLAGSDGSARWSRATSYLVFPQSGWPGRVSVRLRGWRGDGADLSTVGIWLNGRDLLGTFQVGNAWEEYHVAINGGLWKPSDVVIELRTSTTTLPGDDRSVGVLVDSATYHVTPAASGMIVPYPAQVAYGATAAALLWSWLIGSTRHERRKRLLRSALVGILVALLFLFCYRLQPALYPYPLRRLLPAIDIALVALLLLRSAPAWLQQRPRVLDGVALAGIAVWLVAVLNAAHQHVTLSVPGVEKDFRVFATRTDSLEHIFQADGFYNFGYPLLLWLVQPCTAGNPFLAARLVAAVSGAVLLLAGYWLTRTMHAAAAPPHQMSLAAPLTVLLLAFSPLVVQYGLYVGSDMPFAALTALALALMVHGTRSPTENRERGALVTIVAAGCAAGCAFLMRHLGVVLLPWGVLHCALVCRSPEAHSSAIAHWWAVLRSRRFLLPAGAFVAGFFIAALPQLAVNTVQTGQPFYSQQAKNIWLAVYGDIDWGRWGEVENTISLTEIVLRDPSRFVRNWWGNLVGFIGSGAEDTSELGRAVQLRLLTWPANWLAVGGIVAWVVLALRSALTRHRAHFSLVLFVALYALAVCMAFILPRFFLPLTPIYAAAAAWLLCRSVPISRQVAALLILLLLVWGGFSTGTRSVLQHQPADEVAAVRMTLATLQPGDELVARLPAEVPLAKYSALAHRVAAWPDAPDEQTALRLARSQGVDYLLWDERGGLPPLPNAEAARIGGAGSYGLYRLDQMIR